MSPHPTPTELFHLLTKPLFWHISLLEAVGNKHIKYFYGCNTMRNKAYKLALSAFSSITHDNLRWQLLLSMAGCLLQSKVRYLLFQLCGFWFKLCDIQVLKIMLIVIKYNGVCTEYVLYL